MHRRGSNNRRDRDREISIGIDEILSNFVNENRSSMTGRPFRMQVNDIQTDDDNDDDDEEENHPHRRRRHHHNNSITNNNNNRGSNRTSRTEDNEDQEEEAEHARHLSAGGSRRRNNRLSGPSAGAANINNNSNNNNNSQEEEEHMDVDVDLGDDEDEDEGEDEDEDEEVVLHQPSPSAPLVSSLIRRIEKVMKMMREAVEEVRRAADAAATAAAHPSVDPDHRASHTNGGNATPTGLTAGGEVFPADEIHGSARSSHQQQLHQQPLPLTEWSSEASMEALGAAHHRLRCVRDLLLFLWSRLLRVLSEENERCGDSYAQTLDMQERIPAFESLTRTVYRHPNFCEILGELVDSAYEGRPLPEELLPNPSHFVAMMNTRFPESSGASSDRHETVVSLASGSSSSATAGVGGAGADDPSLLGSHHDPHDDTRIQREHSAADGGSPTFSTARESGASREAAVSLVAQRHKAVLQEHYRWMIKMQRVATFCGVMIIEGSRESFLEPLGMHELCKRLMSEKSRQKRIIPLCLTFCLLDQDDTAVGEAMVQGVPRQLLQSLRHLSHRLFGPTLTSASTLAPPPSDKQRKNEEEAQDDEEDEDDFNDSLHGETRRGSTMHRSPAHRRLRHADGAVESTTYDRLQTHIAEEQDNHEGGSDAEQNDTPPAWRLPPLQSSDGGPEMEARSPAGGEWEHNLLSARVEREEQQQVQQQRREGHGAPLGEGGRDDDNEAPSSRLRRRRGQLLRRRGDAVGAPVQEAGFSLPTSTTTSAALAGGSVPPMAGVGTRAARLRSPLLGSPLPSPLISPLPGGAGGGGGAAGSRNPFGAATTVAFPVPTDVPTTIPDMLLSPAMDMTAMRMMGLTATSTATPPATTANYTSSSSSSNKLHPSSGNSNAVMTVGGGGGGLFGSGDVTPMLSGAHSLSGAGTTTTDWVWPGTSDVAAAGTAGPQITSNFLTRQHERHMAEQTVDLLHWIPQVGELVGRGPGWRFGVQGMHADFGVVVGVAGDSVLVSWIPSEDAPKSAQTATRPIFRYQYTAPGFEVVRWEDYLKIKTMMVDKEMMCFMEFVWVCAVSGVLCQQVETIQYALQFETTQSMISVLDQVDISTSHHRAEMSTEEAEMRAQRQLERLRLRLGSDSASLRSRSEEDWIQTFLQWDSQYNASKFRFRLDRECITRAGWTLNALLGHSKLAYLFLEYDGVRSVLRIAQGPLEVSTTYGCAIILSRLARGPIFEELLRKYDYYFDSIMSFMLNLWLNSTQNDVQTSAGAFLFHCLSFPCVLRYFDRVDGPRLTAGILNRALTSSEEQHDVILANLQLASLRCLNTYLVANLILSTNVVFRKHRSISTIVRNASPYVSLPRDPVQVETILGHLSSSTPTLPDVTLDNVQSRLTLECLTSIRQLIDQGFLRVLIRCVQFYYIQSRWELLIAALQALHVLTVVPQIRPLLVECRGSELSGLAHLLMIVGDLSTSFQATGRNSHREAHLIPCLVTALHVLLHIMTPPPPDGCSIEDATASVTFFNATCSLFRASDGVRTLLGVLQNKKDASLTAKLKYFPVVARAVQLMVVLRRYGDTSQLFDALGVHDVAFQLGQLYLPVQKRMKVDGPPSEHDPTNRFMENLKILKMRSYQDGSGGGAGAPLSAGGATSTDVVEIDQRQAIVAHAVVDYDKQSLLELMARHLESEGLAESAQVLRREGHLPPPPTAVPPLLPTAAPEMMMMTPSSNTGGKALMGGHTFSLSASSATVAADGSVATPLRTVTTTTSTSTSTTIPADHQSPTTSLDDIVRVYLRQQQGRCPHPIEALPQFDLTKSHVYQPLPLPADSTRGVLNRMLQRKMGRPYTKQMHIHDTCFAYNNPCFLFDVTGVGEGLLGESICFVDNGNALAIGTSEGGLTLFETAVDGSDDKVVEQHMLFDNEAIVALHASPDGQLLTAIRDDGHAVVMPRRSLPVPCAEFEHCEAIRISHDSRLALCTMENKSFQLYDVVAKQVVRTFNENALANGTNDRSVAIFDSTSRLVLHDAVLWDYRCHNPIVFRFDRFSETFASMFHPFQQQVIMDEKVWDLRTGGILHTVPTFRHTTSFHTSRAGRALYSFRERSDHVESVVSAVDSLSYEVIFSGEVHPTFKAFAVDPSDRFCAAILEQDSEAAIRVFSTASGFDRFAFAAPHLPDDHDPESDVEEGDDEDEWSIGSSADDESSRIEYTGDDDDDDDDDDGDDDGLTIFRDSDSAPDLDPDDESGDEDSDVDDESGDEDWDVENAEEEEEDEHEEGLDGDEDDEVFEDYIPSGDEDEEGDSDGDGDAEQGMRIAEERRRGGALPPAGGRHLHHHATRNRKRRRSQDDFIPSDPET